MESRLSSRVLIMSGVGLWTECSNVEWRGASAIFTFPHTLEVQTVRKLPQRGKREDVAYCRGDQVDIVPSGEGGWWKDQQPQTATRTNPSPPEHEKLDIAADEAAGTEHLPYDCVRSALPLDR